MLTRVSPAVALAAIESGVARKKLEDIQEYTSGLESKLDTTGSFMKKLRGKLRSLNKEKGKPVRIAFSEGKNSRVLQMVYNLRKKGLIDPVLIGDKEQIFEKMERFGLEELKDVEIIKPSEHPRFQEFYVKYYEDNKRRGVNRSMAHDLLARTNYFGAALAENKEVDVFMSGPSMTYPKCFRPINRVIGTTENSKAAGIYILAFKDRLLFLADCTVQLNPSPEDLADIAHSTHQLFEQLVGRTPRTAFLSYSSFGSNLSAQPIRKAVTIAKEKYPELICEGEVQADVAVNHSLMDNLFNFSELDGPADILIFPDLNSANISYKLLSQLAEATAIGPILVPMAKNVNIFARTANVSEMSNMTILTSVMSQQEEK